MKTGTIVGAIVVFIAFAATANATPIKWAENGHWYDVVWVNTGLSWDEARDLATQSGGHLATLTSREEDAFVRDLLQSNRMATTGFRSYWLGGHQPASTNGPSGQWAWVTGEDWNYQNWMDGNTHPGLGGTPDYLRYRDIPDGRWEHSASRAHMGGYVVEYDLQESSALPATEPGTMLLFGMGLLGLAGFGRKTLVKTEKKSKDK